MNEPVKRPVIDRISIVLRPADGQTLEQIIPFVQLGAHVSIGRGLAVISEASLSDEYRQATDPRDLFVKLNPAGHTASELLLTAGKFAEDETRANYLLFLAGYRAELAGRGEQSTLDLGSLTAGVPVVSGQCFSDQFIEDHLGKKPGAMTSMHIDDRVKMVGTEQTYLTVVFKLPTLNDAHPLIAQLSYGQKALGTEAVVFGLTTGNLMEDEPCEQ